MNGLYWDFIARHEDKLAGNRRMRGPYATWRRFGAGEQQAVRGQAAAFLAKLDAEPSGY